MGSANSSRYRNRKPRISASCSSCFSLHYWRFSKLLLAKVKSIKCCTTITELVFVWRLCSICTSVTKSKAVIFYYIAIQQIGKNVSRARPTHHRSVFPREPLHMTNCVIIGIILLWVWTRVHSHLNYGMWLKGALKQKSNCPPTFLNSWPGFQSSNLNGQSNVIWSNFTRDQVIFSRRLRGVEHDKRSINHEVKADRDGSQSYCFTRFWIT